MRETEGGQDEGERKSSEASSHKNNVQNSRRHRINGLHYSNQKDGQTLTSALFER